MPATEKWSISTNGENYSGQYDTKEEAIAEGQAMGYDSFYVGQCCSPISPEAAWCGEDWIDHVLCQDDYSGEWADGSLNATNEELAELEGEVRPILAAWLERHGLRPTFWLIADGTVEEIEPTE